MIFSFFQLLSRTSLDITAQVAHSMDLRQAMERIASGVAKIPNVLAEPAPDLKILAHTPAGCVVAVRPYCNNSHYWQVCFDTQQAIREALGAAGYPAPEFVVELNAWAKTPAPDRV